MNTYLSKTRLDTYGILFRCSNLFDRKSVVEKTVTREVLVHILLDEFNAEIRVVDTLDLVGNTRDYGWCQ